MTRHIAAVVLLCGGAQCAEIVLPSRSLEREGTVVALYRTNPLAIGNGELRVSWTDALGRLVEDRRIRVAMADENEIRFAIDLRRACAMKNTLQARLTLEGITRDGKPNRRDEQAQVEFIAKPPNRDWWDYEIIMWRQYGPKDFATLKGMGISAGQYLGRNQPAPEFLYANDMRWYAENLATDFYAAYHRYFPDRRHNLLFYEAKALYEKNPDDKEAFKRQPSLSDPAWLATIRERLTSAARAHSPYGPIFYDLGDESGVADLSAYWDFDFSDHSLAEMRRWLKERYGTLGALSSQWGRFFADWNLVVPETTDEAMKRTDGNFSSWADHKEWMDISFARSLRMGVETIQAVDPAAFVGIAGAQMPGWGGYDYWKLTRSMNFFEPYNIGNNIEIIRSLNPSIPVVTTAFARGPWEKHRVWYELLHGGDGLIIWDDGNEYLAKDGSVAPRATETAPYFGELRSGVAAAVMNSERLADPVAIHYSQASMRTAWMLQHQPAGRAWAKRSASTERLDSDFLRLRESWCRLLEDLGLQYRFVAYEQVEQGELLKGGYRVLILPDSVSMSEAEAQAIRNFIAQGGVALTTAEPGTYDEHSRRLERSRLADLAGHPGHVRLKADVLNYHQQRLRGKEEATKRQVAALVEQSGVRPQIRVLDEAGSHPTGVEVHLFRNGHVQLVGLLSNPQLRVDELGPPDFKSNERFEKPRNVRIALPAERTVVNVRSGKVLGVKRELAVTLDPYEPFLAALFPPAPDRLRLAAPRNLARGEIGEIGLSIEGGGQADRHIFRLSVRAPDGRLVAHYSGNLLARRGVTAHRLAVAHNDPPGRWRIEATDVLSGQQAGSEIEVH